MEDWSTFTMKSPSEILSDILTVAAIFIAATF